MNRLVTLIVLFMSTHWISLAQKEQRGYYDAPYIRYEADFARTKKAVVLAATHDQSKLQSEASDQICVKMKGPGSTVEWDLWQPGNGLVLRYSVPDKEEGEVAVIADGKEVGKLKLTSYYSWEYLWKDDNPNNGGVVNQNPKMRFDEVRMKLPELIPAKGKLQLKVISGNVTIDFVEMEVVPEPVQAADGDVVYKGNGSDLKSFIANMGAGKTVYLPAGKYEVPGDLYFGHANTTLKGAGSWHTQIHFASEKQWQGGLLGNAENISYSGLYLTTVRNSRSKTYKAINGVYTSGSLITDVWAEHFECGAWIANYVGGPVKYADGFKMTHCRFRNNYADGINLCKGTKNSVVEHCSFRNNGDDDMAMWSADGMECENNTYQYNTSENCWRASGCAIYGGKNNKAHHLLIKDNLEVGLRVNNNFPGVGFNTEGMHEFSDITIIGGGTFNDLFNNPVGAIDVVCSDRCGTRINNVTFRNIDIVNSKNEAIYISKIGGEGFFNLNFENVIVDGTGAEVPLNNIRNRDWARGYGVLFVGNPAGSINYCSLEFKNIRGTATTPVNLDQVGTLKWTDCNGVVGK
jgi:hypothetical protein